MAVGFRQGTTMSLQWTVRRLNMETAGALANLLRRDENQQYALMRDPYVMTPMALEIGGRRRRPRAKLRHYLPAAGLDRAEEIVQCALEMKGSISALLGLLLLAAPAAVEGQFTYTTNGGAITLATYTGTGSAVVISNFVTSIGSNAFYEKTVVASVTIPGSVTNIEVEAFTLCSRLSSLAMSNGVTSTEE
jgi:hypothetical protein